MLKKNYQKSLFKSVSFSKIFFIILFSIGSYLTYWIYPFNNLALADETQDKFEQDIEAIQERIKNTNIRLDGIIVEKTTLQEVIAELEAEIVNLQASINETQAEIARLKTEIEALKLEIEAQTIILKRILVLLYQRSGASTFELIIAADTFSDYLDDQEYLDRLKEGISDSVRRIQKLQAELELEELRQTKFLGDLEAQEISLQAVRWEQERLLTETLNQEDLFQQQLTQLQNEQLQLEKELEEYLLSLLQARVSLGRVNAGDIIGKNGNTGWSTGPHLHLSIYSPNRATYDPLSFMNNRGLVWPMGGSGGWVSQGYHPGHRALDIAAAEGVPIRAIADGNIIHRGCLFTAGIDKYTTFGVIIDHGDYLSLYIHLQAPNNPQYSVCSINRRSSYGTPSIDYSITE